MKKKWIVFLLWTMPCFQLLSEENFLAVDGAANKVVVELGVHINERFSPCSSFKIVLSLMGYDSQILKDDKTPCWPFQEGYLDYIDSWKASQTPRSWMKNSCLWFSQVLAVHLGVEKMESYLQLLEYGNQDMSGGLTNAWLGGSSLKISAQEQVEFIQKMVRGELSISNDAVEMTKSLLFIEELSEGWKLFGKTGFGHDENIEIGWFVGWVEKGEDFVSFAYNIRDTKINLSQRIPRVKELLERFSLIGSCKKIE